MPTDRESALATAARSASEESIAVKNGGVTAASEVSIVTVERQEKNGGVTLTSEESIVAVSLDVSDTDT